MNKAFIRRLGRGALGERALGGGALKEGLARGLRGSVKVKMGALFGALK